MILTPCLLARPDIVASRGRRADDMRALDAEPARTGDRLAGRHHELLPVAETARRGDGARDGRRLTVCVAAPLGTEDPQ